uniref:hypothetical protein n=1 Tax=Microbulbifer agarilyticus TaxID=260552 RepID=UPI0002558E2E|nr:hypothetical protein [Microbulbifer agarilyticus]
MINQIPKFEIPKSDDIEFVGSIWRSDDHVAVIYRRPDGIWSIWVEYFDEDWPVEWQYSSASGGLFATEKLAENELNNENSWTMNVIPERFSGSD